MHFSNQVITVAQRDQLRHVCAKYSTIYRRSSHEAVDSFKPNRISLFWSIEPVCFRFKGGWYFSFLLKFK